MNQKNLSVLPITQLKTIHQDLTVQRMRKDREFTEFLDEHDKDMSEDFDHPQWTVYRNMLSEYTTLNTNLALVNYYIQTNV